MDLVFVTFLLWAEAQIELTELQSSRGRTLVSHVL